MQWSVAGKMSQRRVRVVRGFWESPERGQCCSEAKDDDNAAFVHVAEIAAIESLAALKRDTAQWLKGIRLGRENLAKALGRERPKTFGGPGEAAFAFIASDAHKPGLCDRDFEHSRLTLEPASCDG